MSIPHCFDHLLGAKPKHPQVGALAQAAQSVDEIAPLSQIPGLNLAQFNNIGNFRPNMAQHIPRSSTRSCRARNLFNWSSIELFATKSIQAKLFSTWQELSNGIPSSPPECDKHIHMCWSLIATALHTMWHWSKITEPPEKVWRLLPQFILFDPKQVSSSSPYIYHPLLVFSSSLLMKTSCLRLKLVELNFFASFNADDQSKLTYLTLLNIHNFCCKFSKNRKFVKNFTLNINETYYNFCIELVNSCRSFFVMTCFQLFFCDFWNRKLPRRPRM